MALSVHYADVTATKVCKRDGWTKSWQAERSTLISLAKGCCIRELTLLRTPRGLLHKVPKEQVEPVVLELARELRAPARRDSVCAGPGDAELESE